VHRRIVPERCTWQVRCSFHGPALPIINPVLVENSGYLLIVHLIDAVQHRLQIALKDALGIALLASHISRQIAPVPFNFFQLGSHSIKPACQHPFPIITMSMDAGRLQSCRPMVCAVSPSSAIELVL
jgi:hypothetical protein